VASSASGGGVIDSVSCVSATACTAAGYSNNETLIESWNGTSWSIVPSPNPDTDFNIFTGVSCVSATACTAAGYYYNSVSRTYQTLLESWDGTSWSIVPSPNLGTNSYLYGVSCAAGTCTATGNYTGGTDTYGTLIESGPASG
jgi:hypothetical protein